MIEKIYNSTKHFYRRFGKEPSLTQVLPLIDEEAGEFKHALQHESQEAAAIELGDIMVVGIAGLQARGMSCREIEAAFERVAKKNNAKTWETHYIDSNGKIARRK